ncbi:hypothetical protein BGZ98_008106 [Dissophora globulifera]|nr:hypothetical protein BGZ98_008106 [Dissophora globulifera]
MGSLYKTKLQDDWFYWQELVKNHQQTLEHLSVSTTAMVTLSTEFCAAIASCEKLQSLTLRGRLVPPDETSSFWSACLLINKLHLIAVSLPPWNDTLVGTSRLQELIVDKPQGRCNGLDLLKHCPRLRCLHWQDSESVAFPLTEFGVAAMTGAWPALEEIEFIGHNSYEDKDLAALFEGMNKLVRLHAKHTGWLGSLSLKSLRKHASLIRTLDLENCLNVDSGMIQTILTSMPALELLKVGEIDCADIVSGLPWIAFNLEVLCFSINMQSNDEQADDVSFETRQRLVFERLSALTRLRTLYVVNPLLDTKKRTLDLRLKSGLSALSTLTRLESLRFNMGDRSMDKEDINWMIESWPRLRWFRGKFTDDPDLFYTTKQWMNSRGIMVFD